jgi:hypothetical protein
MIQAIENQRFENMDRLPGQAVAGSTDFAALFGEAAKTATQAAVSEKVPTPSTPTAPTAPATAAASLGDPDVQGWLNSFYAEQGDAGAANLSYQPAAGAGNNFPAGSVFGPDAIFAQALANQDGNAFAQLTGDNPAGFTSQLPGLPTQQAQQEFDRRLSLENLERLQTGQPIDTTAYWSDPGPITTGGVTYTSQELGYAGPGQSSGPQPIYISPANEYGNSGTFAVPGYSGTVTGIQPGRFYTLQELEQAGLQAGQPDAQFHPGSWSTVTAATVTTSA